MSVSIVIPCYNEEAIIAKVVMDYYNEIIARVDDSELLIVDDRLDVLAHRGLVVPADRFHEAVGILFVEDSGAVAGDRGVARAKHGGWARRPPMLGMSETPIPAPWSRCQA